MKSHQPNTHSKNHQALHLLSRREFLTRFSRHLLFGFLMIGISLGIGILGYYYFENMSWSEAFVNAAMILGGMGPISQLHTQGGLIFAGVYALFSGIIFLVTIGIVFAPVVHRFFIKFHFD